MGIPGFRPTPTYTGVVPAPPGGRPDALVHEPSNWSGSGRTGWADARLAHQKPISSPISKPPRLAESSPGYRRVPPESWGQFLEPDPLRKPVLRRRQVTWRAFRTQPEESVGSRRPSGSVARSASCSPPRSSTCWRSSLATARCFRTSAILALVVRLPDPRPGHPVRLGECPSPVAPRPSCAETWACIT